MLALPVLESMLGGFAQAAPTSGIPKRLLLFYMPNGVHMPAWRPTGEGPVWQLSETLQPLAAVKDKLLVVSGLANRPGQPDGPGDHAAGTGSFLTATHVFKTEGENIRNGISMDQVAANASGAQTPLPSLQLGLDGGGATGNCDSGYSCAYARNISWANSQTPLPKITEPRLVVDRLFAGVDPTATREQAARRRLYRKSVLDYVREDATRLQGRLGSTDRTKMEQYLTGIRELELRIEALENAPVCEAPGPYGDIPDAVAKSAIMNDLMVLSMQCDATRIISYMLSNAGSGRSYNFLGVSEGHHQISHHESLQANYDKLKLIERWEVEQFADLVRKMNAVQELDGSTLLDNSLVFMSSEISDGNRHNHTDLPVLVAGSGGGVLRQDRHIVYGQERPIADLFITMLRAMGVSINQFGDNGTGVLPELLV